MQVNRAMHGLLTRIRRFDEVEGWAEQGAKSCAHWLTWRIGLDPGTAREKVRVARALGTLAKIDEAFAAAEGRGRPHAGGGLLPGRPDRQRHGSRSESRGGGPPRTRPDQPRPSVDRDPGRRHPRFRGNAPPPGLRRWPGRRLIE